MTFHIPFVILLLKDGHKLLYSDNKPPVLPLPLSMTMTTCCSSHDYQAFKAAELHSRCGKQKYSSPWKQP
uniref:Uncharacterized protein n=1 Tax=Anguilla anguilla TaxID=7936 RepID=A0A0E9X063_ANGAN